MRSALSERMLLEPRTLDEALAMMQRDPALTPIAGCTDVYVALQFGTTDRSKFIDIWRLSELRGIRLVGDTLVLGALATHTDIVKSADVQRTLPMLAAASREIGGVQIQNRGTIGGNIANASPAGDTLPVLAAVDAVLVLRSAGGERRVPFNEFYTGYRSSVLAPGELITQIEVPRVEGAQWYRKVGTRAAQAISKVVFAGVRSAAPRLALGSVGPTVVRLRAAESVLAQGGGAEDAVASLARDIAPIDDIRSTAQYRMRVAENLVRRFLLETQP